MSEDPLYIRVLEKLGFNVTRLRWKLYQRGQRSQDGQSRVPDGLRWLQYRHKICARCGAVVPREDRVCPRCEHGVPSVLVYRVTRLLGLAFPRSSPVVTGAFLACCAVIFVVGIMLDGAGSIMRPEGETLYRLGGFQAGRGFSPDVLWRWLTFGLVHGGLMHIAFNAYALFAVGPAIESQIGRRRMVVLITVTQLTSALATEIWYGMIKGYPVFTVGASGWLFGLIGFGVGYFHAHGGGGVQRNFFLQWAGYAFVFGLLIGANNAAHLGGFLGGLPLGYLIQRQRGVTGQGGVWTGAAAISLGLWVTAEVLMLRFAFP